MAKKTSGGVLGRISDAVTVPSAARQFARAHNMAVVLPLIIITTVLLVAGIVHAAQEPRNPAVYLLLYVWSIPLVLTYFYVTRAQRQQARVLGVRLARLAGEDLSRFYVLAATLVWTIFTLAFTLVINQVGGLVTAMVWGLLLVVFWTVTALGFDYAAGGELRRRATRKIQAAIAGGKGRR